MSTACRTQDTLRHRSTWPPLLSIALATALTASCDGKPTPTTTPTPYPTDDAPDRPDRSDPDKSQKNTYEDVIEDAESDEGLFTVHKNPHGHPAALKLCCRRG